jgi:hypothetical protein
MMIHAGKDRLKIMEERVQRLFAVKRSRVIVPLTLTKGKQAQGWPKFKEAL